MYKLIIEDDEGRTTEVPLSRDEISVGRKEGNNIRLTERNVSRHHARLHRHNGTVSIEDLDSYTGVRINGDRISVKTPVPIQVGDRVRIGDYELHIESTEAQAPLEEATQRTPLVALQETTLPGTSPEESAQRPAGESAAPRAWPDATGLPPAPGPAASRPEPTAIVRTADLVRPALAPATSVPQEGARLVVVSTELAGKVFPLSKPETVLGRTDDNDILLDHRSVSRNHAKVIQDGTRYSVVDLNSANGVLVNGEEYKRIDLRRGDVIELGHVKLRFVEAGEVFPTEAELERMRREEPSDTLAGGSGGRSRVGGRLARPWPWVGAAVGVVLVVLVWAVWPDGEPEQPTADNAADASAAVVLKPEPAPTKVVVRDPPPDEKKAPPPRRDPPRVEDKPPPPPPPVDERVRRERDIKAAQEAYAAGDFVKAHDLFKAHASQDGDARRGWENALKEMRAQDDLENAVALRGKDPESAWNKLEVLAGNGTRVREAAQAQLRELRPILVARRLKDAEKALADGNARRAETSLADALELDPNNRDALKFRDKLERSRQKSAVPPTAGGTKDGANKAAEARKAFDDCSKAFLIGNFQDSVRRCKNALQLDPTLSDAHKLLGAGYARDRKYCDSKFHYKKFLELNPNSTSTDRIKGMLNEPDYQACP